MVSDRLLVEHGVQVLVVASCGPRRLIAKVGMPSYFTSAAAVSSWVDSGFEAHRNTLAPPAFSVRIRLAVSVVTCRQAAMVTPLQRLLLGEALAHLAQHRHRLVGPIDALLALVGELQVLHVVRLLGHASPRRL